MQHSKTTSSTVGIGLAVQELEELQDHCNKININQHWYKKLVVMMMFTDSTHSYSLVVYMSSVREYSYVTNKAPFAGKERSNVGSRPRYRASTPIND